DKVSSLRHDELIARMVDKLCALRSAGTPHWCWGYSFPWQTRTIVVPRWAPNAVCTSFVANAMLNAFEQFQNSRLLEIAVSAGDYILKELYWSDGQSSAGFSYPLPSIRSQIHNANFLAAVDIVSSTTITIRQRISTAAIRVA